MGSSGRSEALDLTRGLPTTARDTEALRRAKTARPLTIDDYLRFLDQLPLPTPHELRVKPGPRGGQPFVLR